MDPAAPFVPDQADAGSLDDLRPAPSSGDGGDGAGAGAPQPRLPKLSDDAVDDALTTSPAARALVRTLDVWLLAPLTLLYFLCYLDRSNLANAKAQVEGALGLSTAAYGFASSVFQVGYIACEVPANLVLKRSRPSLWLGALVAAFGAVAACTAAARDYPSLVATRVALGVAESGFPPGVLYFLSMWYTPRELGSRNALFLVAGPLANATGALLAYGLLEVRGWGLEGWQWLFLLEGLPAVALGLGAMAYLPDHPSTCRWWGPDARALAARRVPTHAAEGSSRGAHNWGAIADLARSPVAWAFAALNVSTNIASYGIGAFLPAIIQQMGYTQLEANLRTGPVYLFMAVSNVTLAALSDRWRERGWVIVGCLVASGGGMLALALAVTAGWPLGVQYALTFSLVFYSAASPLMIAWLATAYAGTSDAAVGPALVLTVGSLGAFAGPNVYGATGDDVAGYATGHVIMAGVFFAGAALAAAMRVCLYNRPSDGRLVVRPCPATCARRSPARRRRGWWWGRVSAAAAAGAGAAGGSGEATALLSLLLSRGSDDGGTSGGGAGARPPEPPVVEGLGKV